MEQRKKTPLECFCFRVLKLLHRSSRIEREDWTVRSDRLPEAFRGLRITLLTDLHGDCYGPDQERLLQAVADSRPDLIALSGDIVDEFTDRAVVWPLLEGLPLLAPTYFVTGNHENFLEDRDELLRDIADCGVQVLHNDFVTLERGGERLILAGTEDYFGWTDPQTPKHLLDRIRADGSDPFVVMLYHRNNHLRLWNQLDVDLVLSGHGHGGVIRLPFVGGLLGVERTLFPKDCEGLYQGKRTVQAVSRGVGGARLWNPPHLPTVCLTKQCEP